MGHRCGGNSIHGPSLRLADPVQQHRCPSVAVAAASMGHGWVSAGVRRVPDGLARAPGAPRGPKVPPVSTAGTAGLPWMPGNAGNSGEAESSGSVRFPDPGISDQRKQRSGQPPSAARHRLAPRRHEPGINRKPARRRHLQDRQACFSGILRWHSSRGFHNHGGACRRTPATGAFRPEPAKPETQTDPPPGCRTSPARATPRS